MDTTYAATVIVLLVFVASVISVEVALSAAIIEIIMGVVAGLGLFDLWVDFRKIRTPDQEPDDHDDDED